MKVLLWQDIKNLGKRGEVVQVKPGYARNYLIPERMASVPTPSMYKELEIEKRRQAKREKVLVSKAEEVAKKFEEISSVTVEVNTNEEGQLYGSVTPAMVAEALLDQGVKIEAGLVEINEPIKQVGVYEVDVRLFKEVCPKVKIWVVSSKTLETLAPADAEGAEAAAVADASAPAAEAEAAATDAVDDAGTES